METLDTPVLPGAVFYLHAAAELQPVEADLPKEVNGQPVAYFWADGIRAGRYVHPAGKFELKVDRDRLDGWVHHFRQMRLAGVDVPVPVDHSTRARDNLGYVVDVRREGDTLKLLHQLIGDDAIRLASRNKVSLGIDPAFKDGQGRAFGDCIVHSSLTPVPIVPGQAGLVPMSSGGDATAHGSIVLQWDGAAGDAAPVPPPVSPTSGDIDGPLDALVRGGCITPACRQGIIELMNPSGGAGQVLLSTTEGHNGLFPRLIAALSRNVAFTPGEQSGIQTLARVIPGEEPTVDPTLQLQMVRMANGK